MTSAPHALASLDELCRFDEPVPWRVDLVQRQVGGGRTSRAELAAIESHPDATALTVSGLDQSSFEALVGRYGAQFSGIHFWKCPRMADLAPLEDLPNLTHVAFFWNQRATRLWDFSRTPQLRGLNLDDFTRIHDLSDLRTAASLEELEFGNKVWPKFVCRSLDPLESLTRLQRLTFNAKRIEDGRIEPLAALRKLEYLGFPSNLFTTEQVAWLRARLPEAVTGPSLEPIRVFPREPEGALREKDVLVVGKRKPWLNSKKDAERIQRSVDDFWRMAAGFKRHPHAIPVSTTEQSGT